MNERARRPTRRLDSALSAACPNSSALLASPLVVLRGEVAVPCTCNPL